MIRIAVISDTHTHIAKICEALRKENPDGIIHLGDHERDSASIAELFPEIPMYSVCGNCDIPAQCPVEMVVELGPVKAFITHGHLYDVRWSTQRLVYAAMEAGAQLAMYGHTHIPDHSEMGGVTVLSPGTAGQGRSLTWALVTVQNDGSFTCEIRDL